MAKDTQPVEIVAGTAAIGTVELTGSNVSLHNEISTTIAAGALVEVASKADIGNLENYTELRIGIYGVTSHAFLSRLYSYGKDQVSGYLWAESDSTTAREKHMAVTKIYEEAAFHITNNDTVSHDYTFDIRGVR